ncbi:MAG: hypothetical protein ACO391_04995 [Pseudomonadales bacterium]
MSWTLIFKSEALVEFEEEIRIAQRALDTDARKAFLKAYQAKFKDPDTYTSLCYALGFGLHHLYLGHFILAAIDLLASGLFWFSVYLFFTEDVAFGVFPILVAGYNGLDFLFCLFWGDQIVRYHNSRLARSLMRDGTPSA